MNTNEAKRRLWQLISRAGIVMSKHDVAPGQSVTVNTPGGETAVFYKLADGFELNLAVDGKRVDISQATLDQLADLARACPALDIAVEAAASQEATPGAVDAARDLATWLERH